MGLSMSDRSYSVTSSLIKLNTLDWSSGITFLVLNPPQANE
jgi:hypothetical protein